MLGLDLVQARRGLIDEQHGRARTGGTSNGEEASKTEWHLARSLVQPWAKLEPLDQRLDRSGNDVLAWSQHADAPIRPANPIGSDEQVLAHRHVVEQLQRLERSRDPGPCTSFRVPPSDRFTLETKLAITHRREPAQRVDEARLPCTVGADEPHDPSGSQRQRERVHGRRSAVAHRDALSGDDPRLNTLNGDLKRVGRRIFNPLLLAKSVSEMFDGVDVRVRDTVRVEDQRDDEQHAATQHEVVLEVAVQQVADDRSRCHEPRDDRTVHEPDATDEREDNDVQRLEDVELFISNR